MTPDKRAREQMRAHCDTIHDDDGIDPREFFKVSSPRRKDERKDLQLCRQAAETLEQVLSSEIGDEQVSSLHVTAVTPAPDASRLLVTLCTDLPIEQFNREEVERRLEACRGRLRCAVAGAITRRKTPQLTFLVIGPDQAAPAPREGER